jgi:hypothetical protein
VEARSRTKMKLWGGEWILLFCLASRSSAHGQVVHVGSRPAPIARRGPTPRVTILGTITMMATPAAVSFNLVRSGTSLASAPIAITTSWSGVTLLSTISVYAYFSNPNAALSGGTPAVSIPASCVLGKNTSSGGTPTAFTAFTQSGAFGSGNSLQLFTELLILGLGSSSRVDTLSLEINLSTLPQLPAGSYTGMLLLQTQAL